MSDAFEIYSGVPGQVQDSPPVLRPPVLGSHAQETAYFPDPSLVSAVNVALALGQPLLVSGAPGCGKTQLAYSVARELGLGQVNKVSVASTTELGDLYYSFDTMSQFRDLQREDTRRPPESYLRFTGFGRALLLAGGPGARIGHHPANVYSYQPQFKRPETAADLLPADFFLDAEKRPITEPTPSVVLIDEIDKAPRDTPNDMLGWLETMSFEIAELGITIAPFDTRLNPGLAARRPLVFFTTNSEKRLPDAFLRRCAYYHITFPSEERVLDIVARRGLGDGVMVRHALEVLFRLSAPNQAISRPPGLAEFIAWVVLLRDRLGLEEGRRIAPEQLAASLPALVKLEEDRAAARSALQEWLPNDFSGTP